jgi:hypothetical protein
VGLSCKFAGHRKQEAKGARRILFSSMNRLNPTADMSRIELVVRTRANAPVDATYFFSQIHVNHAEKQGRPLIYRVRRHLNELHNEFFIMK